MDDAFVKEAEILVVDDEPGVARFLSSALLSAGYKEPRVFTDPFEANSYLKAADPDLITLDICMPGLDGYGLLEAVRSRHAPDFIVPVLAISALDDFAVREKAIKAGARDFLVKPVGLNEFLLHVHSLLEARFFERRMQETRDALEDLVRERTAELAQAHLETIERLGRVAEMRDDATGKHTERVALLSELLAKELRLPAEQVDLVRRAAALHDVGKVAIHDEVLLKRGAFLPEEWDIMRTHARLGAQILAGGKSDLMKMAEQIAGAHHERWDGEGYPRGLRGEEIPLLARVVAVADAFDALTHDRPYKLAWSVESALLEIELEAGRQFDPAVATALRRLYAAGRGLVPGTAAH